MQRYSFLLLFKQICHRANHFCQSYNIQWCIVTNTVLYVHVNTWYSLVLKGCKINHTSLVFFKLFYRQSTLFVVPECMNQSFSRCTKCHMLHQHHEEVNLCTFVWAFDKNTLVWKDRGWLTKLGVDLLTTCWVFPAFSFSVQINLFFWV